MPASLRDTVPSANHWTPRLFRFLGSSLSQLQVHERQYRFRRAGPTLCQPEHSLMQISHALKLHLLELALSSPAEWLGNSSPRSPFPRACTSSSSDYRSGKGRPAIEAFKSGLVANSPHQRQDSEGAVPKRHDTRSWTCRPRNWSPCLSLASVLRPPRFLLLFLVRLAKHHAAACFNSLVARIISAAT